MNPKNLKSPFVMLIDSHAIIHRAYHAFPSTLKEKNGEPVNAVYGFTSILLNVLNDFDPEYVVCAFDSKEKTFRHSRYSDYKANRKVMEEDLASQIPKVEEVVKAFNIPIFRVARFEADDILGTLVNSSNLKSVRKVIVSGDKDLLQLVGKDTFVYLTGNKYVKPKIYDASSVEEKFGFGPESVVDFKALCGDPSDNIPGVKGVGNKTATQLIKDFGDLESIYENIDKIKSKSVQNKLTLCYEDAQMSRELAQIVKDVPISVTLEEALLKEYNSDDVKEIFQKYAFASLMNRIPKSRNTAESEGSEDVSYSSIKNKKDFDEWFRKFSKVDIFAFDTETTGLNILNESVLGISISFKAKEACYIDFKEFKSKEELEYVISKLKPIFEDSGIKKIGHNIKFDVHMMMNKAFGEVSINIKTKGIYFDTMIAAFILSGGNKNVGLKNLAFTKLGMTMKNLEDLWEGGKVQKGKVKQMMLDADSEDLSQYACADADATWRLYKFYIKEFENSKLKDQHNLFFNIDMPVVQTIADMEREGIGLDKEFLKSIGTRLDADLKDLEKCIFEIVGHEFNIASPKQVGEVLFEEIGLPGGKKTRTGAWQTNEHILLKVKGTHDIVPKILKYRELSKIRSTYVKSLLTKINSFTNKVHTSYNLTIATTGRLSSTDPNLQNIPVSSDIGRKIREAFVAGDGRELMSVDVSQQELRILAHMSGEERLIDAYKNDRDVHAITASEVLDMKLEDVDSKSRSIGKVLNFSLIYGISEFGLAERMEIPREEARELIESYFKTYPKVKQFFDKLLEDSKEEGRVYTMFGRFRDTSGLSSKNFAVRNAVKREVINFPIQGSAADMIKVAMNSCACFLKEDFAIKLNAKLILQIHDELVFELDDDQKLKEKFKDKIVKIMENSVKLKVPVKADAKFGKNWGLLK